MDEPMMRDVERRAAGQPPAVRHGKRHALVIGIDRYQQLRPLENAVGDAREVAERLKSDFGFQVEALFDLDATAEKISAALRRCAEELQSDDDVLIFYAGHGTNHGLGQDRQGYLLPVEASREYDETWLPEADLIRQARGWLAERVFLVLDACYAGAALNVRDSQQEGERDDQALRILVAGTEDQPVPDGAAGTHSPFTRVLLDGLDGLADVGQTPDGIVTAGELITYVEAEVPWRNKMHGLRQTPTGGSLANARSREDFQFRPTVPRLPAPILRNLSSNKAEDQIAAARQLGEYRGSATAKLAGEALTGLVEHATPSEGPPGMTDAEVMEVRAAAIEALSRLGHRDGLDPLARLLGSNEEETLRAAAARGLGTLASQLEGIPEPEGTGLRQSAVDGLLVGLAEPSPVVRDAAKEGLACVLESGDRLKAALQVAERADSSAPDRGQPSREDVLDALARLADHYPHDTTAWPDLPGPGDRLVRRRYLARYRLRREWANLLRQMLIVALFGAVGLGLSFVAVTLFSWRGGTNLTLAVQALLAVSAAAGAVAGALFLLLPRLGRSVSRRADFRGVLAGALLAGLLFSVPMSVPNWYLGIGCMFDACPPLSWLYWLLPGLVVGPTLSLALAGLPWRPAPQPSGGRGRAVRSGQGRAGLPAATARSVRQSLLGCTVGANLRRLLAVILAGALSYAVVRIPRPLSFQLNPPPEIEILLWGAGGAVMGALLALGWCLASLRDAEARRGAAPANSGRGPARAAGTTEGMRR